MKTFNKRIMPFLLAAMMVFSVSCSCIGADAAKIEDIIAGTKYEISGDYIIGIREKTTAAAFEASVSGSLKVSGKSGGSYIVNGDKIKLADGSQEKTAVILGDVNSDGSVTAMDYFLVKRTILVGPALAGEALCAAKVLGQETVSARDYFELKRHILRVIDIYERIGTPVVSTLAYIPIDDRPVNIDRVIYQAESSGLEILTPDKDLYSTKLDGTGTNSNGTQIGDSQKLYEWLKNTDVDYYIISLDQILSGGLVGSRWNDSTSLSLEYEIIDYIIELGKTKKVYLFDTVMRLASTVGYKGLSGEYGALRTYGSQARKNLTGSSLTVENIISGYRYDASGNKISASGLSEDTLTYYLASRARKLRLTAYLLENMSDDSFQYLYYGVDDSTPNDSIQTNEISYINARLGDNALLMAATDELGMMAVTTMLSDVYSDKVSAKVTYVGGGENKMADGYDINTLKDATELHLDAMSIELVTGNAFDIEILILTGTVTGTLQSNMNTILAKTKANLEAGIPTILIDCTPDGNDGRLGASLVNYKKFDIARLLGYSNWTTVANSLGIAISQGVSRYLYIKNSPLVTEKSNESFVKAMTFSYIKDISYKSGNVNISNLKSSVMNDNLGNSIVSQLEAGEILVSPDGGTKAINSIAVSNFRLPWHRAFEMTFDISVKMG